jgi:hypothetical protein
MKKVILLVLFMPLQAYGQIVDDFESQLISNWVQSVAGHWKADTTSKLSGKYSLHHVFDNPDAGTDCIGISLKNLYPAEGITKWSFLIRHGYDPSSQNNWAVFLLSDTDPASASSGGTINGYAAGVDLTGSDDTLRLWKVKGSLFTPVVKCRINWQNDIGISATVKILVERTANGIWTLTASRMNGTIIDRTSGTDNELFRGSWFNVLYRYSSTRDRLLWIDDLSVEGIFHEDKTPPSIAGCSVSGNRSLTLHFSEDVSVLHPENIMLANGNKAVSVSKISEASYIVTFSESFYDRSDNTLVIRQLCDISNNCDAELRYDFRFSRPEAGDVVISEIMADPEPVVSLPSAEYIEISNTTPDVVDLKNWKLSTESQEYTFAASVLPGSGKAILCASRDTALFTRYGKVISLKQFPSLTDAGRLVWLSDSLGNLIHGVEYSSGMYKDELKADGGWSLEMIDLHYPFQGDANWTASVSRKGGTPGSINSVNTENRDIHFSGITNVFAEDSVTILLDLSEPCLKLNKSNIKISGNEINALLPADPLYRRFKIRPQKPLDGSVIYKLDIENAMDFAGSKIENRLFSFGLTEDAATGDILFNELLFNPFPGDEDYIELVNISDKILDASRLQIVSFNDLTKEPSELIPIWKEGKCILPGEYFAITINRKCISDRYSSGNPDYLFQTVELPSMADDNGHLILYNRELLKIDEVSYDEKMHYSFLSSCEGISLEKTAPDAGSMNISNWKSASESAGWGTPGAVNSVCNELAGEGDEEVSFSSTKISPDNDGNEDFLEIKFKLQGTGNVVSISIFDEAGNYIRKLASNLVTGGESGISWDGTAADGTIVRTGIYVILITTYNDSGKIQKWKKVCTVIRN